MSDRPPSRPPRDDGAGPPITVLKSIRQWLKSVKRGRNGKSSLREEVEEAIETLDEAAGQIDTHERALLANMLEFGNIRVEDVMLPRPDIVAVEAHSKAEVERALASDCRLLGVNNRDLRTFETRLDVTLDMVARIPPDVVLVSESGIHTADDVARLGKAGVDAVLVGESLLRQESPGKGISNLVGHARRSRGGE